MTLWEWLARDAKVTGKDLLNIAWYVHRAACLVSYKLRRIREYGGPHWEPQEGRRIVVQNRFAWYPTKVPGIFGGYRTKNRRDTIDAAVGEVWELLFLEEDKRGNYTRVYVRDLRSRYGCWLTMGQWSHRLRFWNESLDGLMGQLRREAPRDLKENTLGNFPKKEGCNETNTRV